MFKCVVCFPRDLRSCHARKGHSSPDRATVGLIFCVIKFPLSRPEKNQFWSIKCWIGSLSYSRLCLPLIFLSCPCYCRREVFKTLARYPLCLFQILFPRPGSPLSFDQSPPDPWKIYGRRYLAMKSCTLFTYSELATTGPTMFSSSSWWNVLHTIKIRSAVGAISLWRVAHSLR